MSARTSTRRPEEGVELEPHVVVSRHEGAES